MSTTRPRSTSRNRSIPSRPTTPLRASSRTSLRSSSQHHLSGASPSLPYSTHGGQPLHASGAGSSGAGGGGSGGAGAGAVVDTPLAGLEPAFAELADGMADLEANMMHLQLLHESLARFGENFAAFLYGLNVNAFCVDFVEQPGEESWKAAKARESRVGEVDKVAGGGVDDVTFMTTDTSFVEHPPPSTKSGSSSRFTTPAPASKRGGASGIARASSTAAGRGRGTTSSRGRPSGLARAKARAAR